MKNPSTTLPIMILTFMINIQYFALKRDEFMSDNEEDDRSLKSENHATLDNQQLK